MDGTPVAAVDPGAMLRHAGQATELLKTLANEQRLSICCLLLEGDRTVTELNESVDLSQSALSQHLTVLREAGVVDRDRDGQRMRYRLTPGPAIAVIEALHGAYCAG
jgi:DNA-binding transcriptional ArsR family regulator